MPDATSLRDLVEELLREWCEGLLRLQVHEPAMAGLRGGILCPACSRIHGRCGDALYPFLRLAHATSNERFLRAAVDVQAWSDHVTCTDGGWLNDTDGTWKGITVFGAVSLAEALHHHGDILEPRVRARWLDRLRRAMAFLDGYMTIDTGNINYPATCAHAMAVAARVLDEPGYAVRAHELAHQVLDWFTPGRRLLFGEGKGRSARGCYPIDLGYNVEESLPALIQYALIADDAAVLEAATASLREHIEFLLPDGGWDNSWGTRSAKWTYWGSRTSDGCQPGMLLLAAGDPVFAEAARRNALMLATCTHGGLLHGGPHYIAHREPPCSHHTFCHAKALAAALDLAPAAAWTMPGVALPRETADGVREYPEVATWLAASGPWRATVTANDALYGGADAHPSGGALTLLWHARVGPVFIASQSQYRLVEPHNMQWSRTWSDPGALPPLTSRLETAAGSERFASMLDLNAEVAYSTHDGIAFEVRGRLVNAAQADPSAGAVPFVMRYRFSSQEFTLTARPGPTSQPLRLVLPVVSPCCESVVAAGPHAVEVHKPGGTVRLVTDAPDGFRGRDAARVFNFAPGMEAVPLVIELPPGTKAVNVTVAVR